MILGAYLIRLLVLPLAFQLHVLHNFLEPSNVFNTLCSSHNKGPTPNFV